MKDAKAEAQEIVHSERLLKPRNGGTGTAGIFSIDADLVVLKAMNWLEDRKTYRIPAIAPYIAPTGKRRFSDKDKADLRDMAKHSGWQEVGGQAMRTRGEHGDFSGEVVGRTVWAGQPEWARGFGMSPAEISAALEKAIAGERLGSKQREIVQAMIDALYEERAM